MPLLVDPSLFLTLDCCCFAVVAAAACFLALDARAAANVAAAVVEPELDAKSGLAKAAKPWKPDVLLMLCWIYDLWRCYHTIVGIVLGSWFI